MEKKRQNENEIEKSINFIKAVFWTYNIKDVWLKIFLFDFIFQTSSRHIIHIFIKMNSNSFSSQR